MHVNINLYLLFESYENSFISFLEEKIMIIHCKENEYSVMYYCYRTLCTEFCLSLQTNGSTMLNLSLLTSDMWAVLIRIFAYHEKVCKLIVLASLFFIMKIHHEKFSHL